jgi:hypothetical protein
MNTKRVTALGIAVTFVGAGLEAGEQAWCKPACDWRAEQPHVPHEPDAPVSTRPVLEFLASGSSSAKVPFVSFDDSANNIVIRLHHDRRAAPSFIASTPSSLLFKLDDGERKS